MHSRILIGDMYLPSYGCCILLGVVLANIFAVIIAKKRKLCVETFFVLEIFGGIGAAVGAKIWYYLEMQGFQNISIERVLSGGWSFYGGFFAGLVTIILVCKINRFDKDAYVHSFLFLVPFVHTFWKVGCFLAGCCYGVQYSGIFSVRFPKGAVVPCDVSLFPVQLLEAIFLLVLTVLFYRKGKNKELKYPISSYIICYGLVRFVVEWFRYHEGNMFISGAQIVAVLSAGLAGLYVVLMQRRKNIE